jgi:hypothetical protein
MASRIRTIDFLPEIFQTPSNQQFLSATLDQLVQPPSFTKVQGFIGSKFGYGVNASDSYIVEPTKARKDYQLEPAVVFKKKDTQVAFDAITYPELIDSLANEGAVVNNHNRLFSNEFYSWDSFADLDKMINYSQYYWIPQGPEPVNVETDNLFKSGAFTINNNGVEYTYSADLFRFDTANPVVTLVRGGTYDFVLNQNTPFYIQTEPGVSGYGSLRSNISTREIFGLNYNGTTTGTMTFAVPLADAQDDNNYPGNTIIDLVTTLPFEKVHGARLDDLQNIDNVTSLEGKTLLFYGTSATTKAFLGNFYNEQGFDADAPGGVIPTTTNVLSVTDNVITCDSTVDFAVNNVVTFSGTQFSDISDYLVYYIKEVIDATSFTVSLTLGGDVVTLTDGTSIQGDLVATTHNGGFEEGSYINVNSNYYTINYEVGNEGDVVIRLSEAGKLPDNQKITIQYGSEYVTRNFVKNSYNEVSLIPVITANLDTLYYQDGTNPGQYGIIKLVDNPNSNVININDILGKTTYTSPNGIKFTNGLKVKFNGNITPVKYKQDQYYVEGVGTGINLLPVSEQLVPEPFSQGFYAPFDEVSYDTDAYGNALLVPYAPDYITINRNSLSKNAWSRSNRWFHIDVLNATLASNPNSPIVTAALNSATARAKRPIIEFYPNLKLFNAGAIGKAPVDYINFTETDAFNQVAGTTTYLPDGETSSLFDGARIIFAGDTDPNVRNKIFIANFVKAANGSEIITLSKAADGDVSFNEQTVIVKGEQYQGHSFYFDGDMWYETQFKQYVNQPPRFDIFDVYGISFSDTSYYPGTDFAGCTLFEYMPGSGADDPILGFPIQYSSIVNIGDISFNVSLNTDEYNFVYQNQSITTKVGTGYVHAYDTTTNYTRFIGWQTATQPSFQYQIFNLVYAGAPLTCDVPVMDQANSVYPVITVYVNNKRTTDYTYTTTDFSTVVTLTTPPSTGTPVEILLYSDAVSTSGYYQIPSNFDHNPFNDPVTTINLGDLRGHYKSICNNVAAISGASFGPNNYRDLGNLVPYGTRIIQNSGTLAPAAIFAKNSNNNLFTALRYNAAEYIKFKALLVDTVNKTDYNALHTDAYILDDVLDQISSIKTETNSFFWSDMVPSKGTYTENSYTLKSGINVSNYPLSAVYDYTVASYSGLLVYLTRTIDGVVRNIQLVKDRDYTVSDTYKQLTVTIYLQPNDTITIKEYTQTYGSYVPNTPTKIGLYPSFLPEVVLDSTYMNPTYFIKGHDGSYTKLYGDYENGFLSDFRDRALFEFETRVYNNIKVKAKLPLEYDDIFPGQFRTTDYSVDEVNSIYSTQFLNWVGMNRVNYTSQFYEASDEFTWNYKQSINKLDNSPIKQGNWRGIYMWLYDTANPDTNPWEMLGITNKPDWWDARYGAAPYTSDNLLLWTDISNGFIWNNGDSTINSKRIRPDLLKIIPVDTKGRLVSPFTTIVNSYDRNTFRDDWATGDMGPAEYSYRKSSTWPFDLMRIFALTKPAILFALGLDLDAYKYNYEFSQYLVYDRLRGSPSDLTIYGGGVNNSAHSYMNWVVDYLNQYGIDGSAQVTDYFQNLDVRLSYRLAGFSDKQMLKFFAEKGSPNSKNNSLLIPDESYNIILYENQPYVSITYSSVIIQRTALGYKVYGNSQDKAYFVVRNPIANGLYENITVANTTVHIATKHSNKTTVVPYGTEYRSLKELAEFISGYGAYLETSGMIFQNVENALEMNWSQMIAEIIYWTNSGWSEGSTVNVNPAANQITITNDYGIVQPLTIYNDNFILNQNLLPIAIKDLSIVRDGTTFSAKALNQGDSISFMRCNVNTIEHLVIFDNVTVFNDTMFNLVTGLRQQRIYIKGNKTAEWNGTMNAAGFIINQDNIEEWVENKKYAKGTIVKYKNEYWIANKVTIAPDVKFNKEEWSKTSYETIQQGLLPNPSTKAYESTLYYNTNVANLKNDADLLSFSLIGYRPRTYLSDANFDDNTQVNLYKSIINSKGTLDSFDTLLGATIQQSPLSYEFHENWAIKTAEYGGILNRNFIDIQLDESQLTGNPAVVGIAHGQSIDIAQQQVQLYDIKNYSYAVNNTNILPSIPSTSDSKLPSAGYVSLDDVRYTGYYIDNLDNKSIADLYKHDYVWIADKVGEWKVYTPLPMEARVVNVINNLNNTATIVFDKPHGLVENDPFGIINYTTSIDGYYNVGGVLNNNAVVVVLTLDASITKVAGSAGNIVFGFTNQRVERTKDIAALPLLNSEYTKNKVWVDKDINGEWNVMRKTSNYLYNEFPKPTSTTEYGSAVSYSDKLGYFVADAPSGKVYRYVETGSADSKFALKQTITQQQGFGTAIVKNDNIMVISQPDPYGDLSLLYVYRIVHNSKTSALVEEQIIPFAGLRVGDSLTLSGDGNILYASIIDLNVVVSMQLNLEPTLYDLGLRLSEAVVPGATQFTVYGNVGQAPEGRRITFTNFGNDDLYTIVTTQYNPLEDTTTIYVYEEIPYSVASMTTMFVAVINYSILGGISSEGLANGTDLFSYSLATNYDGTKLFVGSPQSDFSSSLPDTGYAFMFDRLVEQWEVVGDSQPGAYALFLMPWPAGTNSMVYINGVRLNPAYYLFIPNDANGDNVVDSMFLLVGPQLKSGDIVMVSSGNMVLNQEIASYDRLEDIDRSAKFGWSLDCNNTGSELLIGSPFNLSPAQTEGAVFRYISEGKHYGRITGILQCHLLEPATIFINGFSVTLPDPSTAGGIVGDAYYVANRINLAVINNVFAYATEDNRLVIRLRDQNLGQPNNLLNISVFQGNVLAEMGIAEYVKVQTIYDPHESQRNQFGYKVKFNEKNSFAVSAPAAHRYLSTTFDFTDDEDNHNDTVFDNNFTNFEDVYTDAGAVYMYDYLPSYNETLLTASYYVYAQSLPDVSSDYGRQPYYGQSLDFYKGRVMIGTPLFKAGTVNGQVTVYENTSNEANWSVYRKSTTVTDITKIQKIQLFDNITDVTLESLDYFDPLQGKLLGPIRENIDYITSVDPAGYNNSLAKGNMVWGKNEIGKIWFDVSTTKFINYHQNDLAYNSKYWGNVFPGSVVTVYSWIESDVLPAFYAGKGKPLDFSKYSTGFETDAGGNLVNKYYYWVRNTETLFTLQGKTLTDAVIAQYIADPQGSGLAYFAALAPNVYSLFNVRDYIRSTTTNLHIGFGTNDIDIPNHAEYQLIRTNYPNDFLEGVPDNITYKKPSGLYNKLLDSFAGVDELGVVIPNPALPKLLQIGVGVRPNQGLFINRFKALENYLTYANYVLKQYPTSEFSAATFLNEFGDTYDTRQYWTSVYWWDTGYSDNVKTAIEVQNYYDLAKIPNVKEGLIVGVIANSQGKREVYRYTNGAWARIGLQDGTIQFLSTLWDYQSYKVGFGDVFYDTVAYDAYPSVETRNIIRALNEQIYVGELNEYRNKALILMFEYIQSENVESHNYLPWLNKTSLADVSYNIRSLVPYEKYQSDSDNLLTGYLNEVKPYHVVLKEFYFTYTGNDTFSGAITDFDVPSTYNSSVRRYVSPQLTYGTPVDYHENSLTDPIWTNNEYTDWFANYGLSLTSTKSKPVAVLTKYITNISQTIQLDNARGMPITGLIKIDDELIAYNVIDREKNTISGLSRGANNTVIASHYPNTVVYSDLPGAIVLDTGRGYIDPPVVTAYVDTTKYPAPSKAAILKAVMSGDKVIDITVVDPGAGYVVAPEIIFEPAYSYTLSIDDFNFQSNLLTIDITGLTTGDLVKIVSPTPDDGNNGVVLSGYYYVHVLGFNQRAARLFSVSNKPVASLHYTYSTAVTGEHKAVFNPNGQSVNYQAQIVPRAVAVTVNTNIREFNTTIRLDRTSYNSKIEEWKSGIFWPSPFNSLGNDSSTDTSISYGQPFVEPEFYQNSAHGIGPKFTVYNEKLIGTYAATFSTPGAHYAVNDTITVPGDQLGGVSPANDCTLTITSVSNVGGILSVTASGTPVATTTAGYQGSVLPITGIDNVTDTTVVRVNYLPSTLKPGQIKGLKMYFYKIYEPYIYDDTNAGGAKIEIHRPRFNPLTLTNQYFMKIIDFGSIYHDEDQIIISGALLGGVTGTNDAVINIRYAGDGGQIQIADISGVAVGGFKQFYVQPVSATQLALYDDSKLLTPTLFSSFDFEVSDFGYLPEPLLSGGGYKYVASAIVSYDSKVWRCIESNSDDYFDYNKWVEIKSDDRTLNALDRIMGFYKPTVDMPAKNLAQLVDGVTYPHNVYYGNGFAPEDVLPIEFVLKDQQFYPRDVDIKAITFDGDGYIAVGETPAHSVVLLSDDGVTWNVSKLAEQALGVTDIVYSGVYYIVTTQNVTTPILISTDKRNWTTVGENTAYDFTKWDYTGYDTVSLTAPKESLYSLSYVNNKFIALGSDIVVSDDGINWKLVYSFGSQLENTLKNVHYANINGFAGYIVVGSGYQVIGNADTPLPQIVNGTRIVTSIDGSTWTTFNPPFTYNGMNTVTSSPDIIVTGGEQGEIWHSPNTRNWIKSQINGTPMTDTLRDSEYGNGVFMMVGDNGTIVISEDGITWDQVDTPVNNNFTGVWFDGTSFYVVGDKGAIIRSHTNGATWQDISFITTDAPLYDIKGSDFLSGYGPEELVPGVITDQLTMTVSNAPGTYWDNDTFQQTFLYGYTGFNMKSIMSSDKTIYFGDLVLNPAQIAVFVMDSDTMKGYRTYAYTTDWINRTVTMTNAPGSGTSILVEVYEIGNGRGMVRSNSQLMPMTIDSNTGYSQIVLNQLYRYTETPIVYVNGNKMEFNVDYSIVTDTASSGINTLQILFNQTYDDTVDYVSFAVLADSTTDINSNHYGYTVPETEVFEYDGSSSVFDLSNFVGGDNADNAIVEINGYRRGMTDYSIDNSTNQLTVDVALTVGDIVSVTSFNDTQRQYLNTDTSSSLVVKPVHSIDNSETVVVITLTHNFNLSNGDSIHIDGLVGASQLNGNKYYVNILQTYSIAGTTFYPYQLFTDQQISSPVYSTHVDSYISGGFVCTDSGLLTVSSTVVTIESDSSTFTVRPTDPTRSWVTINGQRVSPNRIRYVNHKMFILEDISSGDGVIATTMIDGATPNESAYIVTVDKNGSGAVYKANPNIRTWIVRELSTSDDTIYFRDVASIVTEGSNTISINGEVIRFTSIDYNANTVSGLTRGINGTGVKPVQLAYSYAYGVSDDKRLADSYYNTVWNSKVLTSRGDPLQLSSSPAAKFLELGII